MSSKTGQVKVAGRFPAGERVALVKVDGEHVLRAAGGKTIDRKKVDDDGVVVFTKDVELGARYFVTGYDNGRPVEVRCTGITEEAASELTQPPVGRDVRKFGDGTLIDGPAVGDEPDVAQVEAKAAKPRARASRPRSRGDQPAGQPLAGKALKDRAKELGVEKYSTLSASKLRAAVARKEKAAA